MVSLRDFEVISSAVSRTLRTVLEPGTLFTALFPTLSGADSCARIPSNFPLRAQGSVWLPSQQRPSRAAIGSLPDAQHDLAVHCGLVVFAAQCAILENCWAYWQSRESFEELCLDMKGLSWEGRCGTPAYRSLSPPPAELGKAALPTKSLERGGLPGQERPSPGPCLPLSALPV